MRPCLSFFMLMVVWLATTGISCRLGPAPLPGERSLNVPYYAQPPQAFWCGPASVQMWQAYAHGISVLDSQQFIFNWMTTFFPAEASEFGVSPRVIAAAASYFVGGPMTDEIYGGALEQRRALADLSKNIYWGDPVISIANHGFHAVIVVGVTWRELEATNPGADWVIVHDPLRSARTLWTVGQWVNDSGQACATGSECMRSVMRAGRRSFAQLELDEFDYLGGVYSGPPPPGATGRWKVGGDDSCYWDQNDSGPDQCSAGAPTGRWKVGGDGSCYWDANDSGPNQCSPSPAASFNPGRVLWRILAQLLDPHGRDRRIASRWSPLSPARHAAHSARVVPSAAAEEELPQGTSRARRHSTVPRPFATARDGILANFYSAVNQTRLDRLAGLESLTSAGTTWRVRDVIPVTTIGGGSNYYLLHVVDHTGAVIGAAAVDEEGFLMGYEDAQGLDLVRPKTLGSAEAAVRVRAPSLAVRARRYVYAPGTLEPGASHFAPLARIEGAAGDYYVNTAGDVFFETAGSASAPPVGDGQRRVLVNRSSTRTFSQIR